MAQRRWRIRAEEYERVRDAGITDVVDLREAGPDDAQRLEALGLAWHHLAVPDQSAPNMGQLIAIGSQLQARKFSGRVYIHCGGGFIAAL
jgi:hypothetical protein